jgi:peptide deformylase
MFKLATWPDRVLSTRCELVNEFNDDLRVLIDNMAEFMYVSRGVGLAAPQVGIIKRIIVVDPSSGESGNELMTMINPIITFKDPKLEMCDEGCLSLPGVLLSIPRSVCIDVDYHDIAGRRCHKTCKNLSARIVQHEIEHLDGLTMLSKVGPLTRRLALSDLLKSKTE